MAKNFKLDGKGAGELLRGREVQRMVRASGDRIARRAGPGFEADTWVGNRAISGVITSNAEAMRAQSRNNMLQRSVDAGRVR